MKQKTALVVSVLVLAFCLYLAGVFSGLYANKILETRTEGSIRDLEDRTAQNIRDLEAGTQEQLVHLNEYTGFLETQLSTMQLEQLFMESLSPRERCSLSNLSINFLVEELQLYREQLPFRIELYEKQPNLPEDYWQLKEQYNSLSVRTWIMARNVHRTCGGDYVYSLYFYDADCRTCVEQGEQLDLLPEYIGENDLLLFTIDAGADNLVIEFIKEFYNINQTPAILINEELFQGRLFTAAELGDVS